MKRKFKEVNIGKRYPKGCRAYDFQRQIKRNPEKFTHNKRCGYSVDFQWLERASVLAWDESSRAMCPPTSKSRFMEKVFYNVFEKSLEQGNPQTKLIEKEEEIENKKFETDIKIWLIAAMNRLPKKYKEAIFLRFRLDNREPFINFRTTKEVSEIMNMSQSGANRRIKSGLIQLKRDFKRSFQPPTVTKKERIDMLLQKIITDKKVFNTVEINEWLFNAMTKLTKDQEICLYFKYRFDTDNPVHNLMNTNEIVKILGICKSGFYRHIQKAITRLQNDFKQKFS